MNISTLEDLFQLADEIIDVLEEHQDTVCVPLDIAYQLKDELANIIPDDEEE